MICVVKSGITMTIRKMDIIKTFSNKLNVKFE